MNILHAVIYFATAVALAWGLIGWAKYYALRKNYRLLYRQYELLTQNYKQFITAVDKTRKQLTGKPAFMFLSVVIALYGCLVYFFARDKD